MPTIELSHLTKRYRGTVVLSDNCARFCSGLIHGIIGRNGSGKTVLLKCICGFTAYEDGEIIIDGEVIGRDREMPKKAGVIIETPGFMPNMSASRNLNMLARLSGRATKTDVINAIESVGLDPNSKKHVGKYSLGMRQRLGIAQAIMEDNDLLILDEPLIGLDEQGLVDMRKMLRELRRAGKTILLASHFAEDIDCLCDTVHRMDSGMLSRVR